MQSYAGLDVSLRQTSVCVVDQTGKIMREGMIDSDPDVICNFIRTAAPNLARIGLETGATSTWLWTELKKRGQPVICIDARHAKAALKMQINKSDRNDAAGIARIMQTGWYKEVRVKDLDSHAVRALLASRALLVELKRDLENQIRGLLKNFGLVIGRSKMNTFTTRATELIDGRPELAAAIEPLLKARDALAGQIDGLDRNVLRLARSEPQVRRFMTVPGVGPITALCYLATIDDPARFKKSRSVGAYVGLTTRRYASGETDRTGRISKCGDGMLRSYLYEAANVLLTRVTKWSALTAWGMRIAKRRSMNKARAAVARKLAVILHRMWIDGTEFCWSKEENSMQPSRSQHKDPAARQEKTSLPGRGNGEIVPGYAMPQRQSALHTLIRQSHQAPACEGHSPNAERTVGPARITIRELDARPGIRERPGSLTPSPGRSMSVQPQYRPGATAWRERSKTAASSDAAGGRVGRHFVCCPSSRNFA